MSAPECVALEGDYDAVVVGAGFGGLYALHRLRELGLSVIGSRWPRSADLYEPMLPGVAVTSPVSIIFT
jgi:cation diffusion facilitator CzcD-associated flavoprotein CzcO